MKTEIVKSEFKLMMTLTMIGLAILSLGLLLWMTYVWLTDMKEIGLF